MGPSDAEPEAGFSNMLAEQSIHVVVLGSGPGSELWSLLYFMSQGTGPTDAAPWGVTLSELRDLFIKKIPLHVARHVPLDVPVVDFHMEDMAHTFEPSHGGNIL